LILLSLGRMRLGTPILDAMKKLIGLFAKHSADRATLDELERMIDDRNSWRKAHDLFQRIRHKTLAASKRGDARLGAQFAFEEACAKTLYNLAQQPAPFDADSPYWIVPHALTVARHYKIPDSDIIKLVAP
jgi:hypothetical protein